MMSDLSALILNVICFFRHSDNPIRHKLAQQAREHAEAEFEESEELDEEVRLYYDVLVDIIEGNIDIDNTSDLSHTLVNYQTHRAVKQNPDVLEQLKTVLNGGTMSNQKLGKMEKDITNHILWAKGNRTIRKMNSKSWKAGAARDDTKKDMLLREIKQHAEDLQQMYADNTGGRVDKTVDFIDMSDEGSVRNAVETHRARKKVEKIKTGLQGLNRVLEGGIDKGEFGAFAALSHNYKSGLLMSLARWTCIHNSPGTSKGVIPTVVFISLENEIFQNTMEWFRSAYVNAFHKWPEGLSDDEIIKYITDVYSKRGFRLLVFRRLGENFGIDELVQLKDELERSGYRIVEWLIDYMHLMKLPESDVNQAKAYQNLYSQMRDLANHENQTVLTGLPLKDDATMLADSGQTYIVKRFTGGHIADSKAVKRELDLLMFMHIEENQHGVPHLTFCWNKRRYYNPPKEKFTAYPFTATGIMDDINGNDKSVSDIYTEGTGNEATADEISEEITF